MYKRFNHLSPEQDSNVTTMLALQQAQLRLSELGPRLSRLETVLTRKVLGRVLGEPIDIEAERRLQVESDLPHCATQLAAGTRIDLKHGPLLLSSKLSTLKVFKKLSVGVLTLIDESVEDGESVRDSHARASKSTAATVVAMLNHLGARPIETDTRFTASDNSFEQLELSFSSLCQKCALVIVVGFLTPRQQDYIKLVRRSEGETLSVRDVVLRPLGTVQILQGERTFGIGISSHMASAFTSFVLFVSPLIRKMQGRNEITPSVFSYNLEPTIFSEFVAGGVFMVKEVVDILTGRPTLRPCIEGLSISNMADATGFAWRPFDMPARTSSSVAYFPFSRWLY